MAAEGEDEPLAKVLKAIREDGRQRRADEERRHAELKETLANSRMPFADRRVHSLGRRPTSGCANPSVF